MENQLNVSKNPSESQAIVNNEQIIKLLTQQNQLLESINSKLVLGMISDGKKYHFDTEINDINMSIGNMVGFLFKWFIASIPLGIVLGIVYAIFFRF